MQRPLTLRCWMWIATALFGAWVAPAAAAPRIDDVRTGPAGTATLSGSGFGAACPRCEVIADFGTLRYALTVQGWSESRISVTIPDLNLAEQVRLQVVTPGGVSNVVSSPVARRLVPPGELSRPVRPPPRDLLSLSQRSDQKVGAKGEERLEVGAPPPACGKEALLFDHARIVFAKRRFGDAQLVATPKPGCTRCDPLVVRWYHEPTGHLDFQVHVYRRRVEGICPARKR